MGAPTATREPETRQFSSLDIGFTRTAEPEKVDLRNETVDKYIEYSQERKISLSQLLERLNPTDPANRSHDGTDAYQRQLRRFNIRLQSDIVTGTPCSTLAEFFQRRDKDGRMVDSGRVVDYLDPSVNWSTIRATAGSVFESNDPQSWVLFPEYINRQLRVTPIPMDILGELIAKVSPIDSIAQKTIYMEDIREQRRMMRVPEGAELPIKYFSLKEHDVAIYKYGLRLKNTYEFARRIRLDIFSLFLQRIAAQNKLDQAETAIDVIINGDGNANAVPSWNLTTLDPNAPAGPGTQTDTYLALYGYPNQQSTIGKGMTYNGFLKWKATLYPMAMSTVVGRLNELLQIITLQFPNINPLLLLAQFNAEGVNIGSIELAQDMWRSVRLVYMPFMVGGILVGLDKSLVLEELVEVNSNITENARDIRNQTSEVTISQNVGFNKIINEAASGLYFA